MIKGREELGWQGRAIAWMLSLAPVLLILSTYTDKPFQFQNMVKFYSLPILVAELMVVTAMLMERIPIGWPPKSIGLCLAAFLLHAWIAATRADDMEISIAFTLFLTLHIAFGIAVFALMRARLLATHMLLNPMLTGFALFAILLLLFILLHHTPGHDWVHGIPAFKNIRWFGYYAAATVGLCAGGWMRGNRLYLALAVAALALALWTGSRGTFASICGGYILVTALFPFMRRGWHNFLLLALLGIALAYIFNFLLPLGQQGPDRLFGNSGSSGRLEIWGQTLQAISTHPWMGYGEAQFRRLINGNFVQPHNIVLQLLLAWGFVGGALVAVEVAWLANRIRINISAPDAPFLFAAANLLAFSLIDGSLFHVQSTALFALCVGALGAASRATTAPSQAGETGPPSYTG